MVNDAEDDNSVTKPLGRLSVFYYGVGHMLNDITASCWFTYLLLFLTDIGLSPRYISKKSLDSTWIYISIRVYAYMQLHLCVSLWTHASFFNALI